VVGGVPSLVRCRGISDGGAASRAASWIAAWGGWRPGARSGGRRLGARPGGRWRLGARPGGRHLGTRPGGRRSRGARPGGRRHQGARPGWRRRQGPRPAGCGVQSGSRERLQEARVGGVGKRRPGAASMTRATLTSGSRERLREAGACDVGKRRTCIRRFLRRRPAVASGSSEVRGFLLPVVVFRGHASPVPFWSLVRLLGASRRMCLLLPSLPPHSRHSHLQNLTASAPYPHFPQHTVSSLPRGVPPRVHALARPVPHSLLLPSRLRSPDFPRERKLLRDQSRSRFRPPSNRGRASVSRKGDAGPLSPRIRRGRFPPSMRPPVRLFLPGWGKWRCRTSPPRTKRSSRGGRCDARGAVGLAAAQRRRAGARQSAGKS
jgi:hypothetical protein